MSKFVLTGCRTLLRSDTNVSQLSQARWSSLTIETDSFSNNLMTTKHYIPNNLLINCILSLIWLFFAAVALCLFCVYIWAKDSKSKTFRMGMHRILEFYLLANDIEFRVEVAKYGTREVLSIQWMQCLLKEFRPWDKLSSSIISIKVWMKCSVSLTPILWAVFKVFHKTRLQFGQNLLSSCDWPWNWLCV